MICPKPKCGKKLRVRNTEKLVPQNIGTPRPIVRTACSIVGWYTNDFVARVRVCNSCGYSTLTIEVEAKDLRCMFNEVANNGIAITEDK